MANIDYPSWLPLPQRASKNMTIDTGFRVDQPSVGPMIIQPLTYDLKVQWSLTWIMTIQEERAFQLWLRDANYGLAGASKWFNMMVNLGGSGLMMQELAFTQFPKQSSLTHGIATWTGTVVANNLNNDDDEFAEIIIGLPPEWYSILDIVVNQTLPEYVVPPIIPDTSPINLAMVALDSRVNFTRAGAASYVGSNGLIQQAAANQWPLEYLGGVGRTEPEAAVTNVLIRSSELENAVWTKTRTNITANATASPDGLISAEKLIATNVSGGHTALQTITPLPSTQYTFSVFLKSAEYTKANIITGIFASQVNPNSVFIDMSTGTITSATDMTRCGIKSVGNGWYRVWTTSTTTASPTTINGSIGIVDASGNASFTGDNTSGIYAWGAQIEASSVVTSYIPTTTSIILRPAAAATIPANGASAIKITYSTGETTTLPFGGASSIQIPAATKAWSTRYITLIEYLP